MDLILHIGTEKTGSTLLQKWLYSNKSALSGEGVFLSTAMGHPYQRKLVSFFVDKKDDFWMVNGLRTPEEKNAFYAGFMEEVESELDAARRTHHTAIITSEHFHSRMFKPDELADFAQFCTRNFETVKIVCYLRPQWKVRKSLFTTSLLNGGVQECHEYQRNMHSGSPYYNYYALYERWSAAFSPNCINLRMFDASRFPRNDLRRDFLSTLPRPLNENDIDFKVKSANESLSQLMADAFLTVNRTDPQRIDGRLNDRNILYKSALRKATSLNRGVLEDTLASSYATIFTQSNTALARLCFDREALFHSPERLDDLTKEVMTTDEVGAMVRDIVGTLVEATKTRLLVKSDAVQLRQIAQKAEKGVSLDTEDIEVLLALAKRAKG